MPVYNSDMEEALLSSVFKDNALFPILVDLVNAQDFYWSPHKWLWTSFLNLHEAGSSIDIITASEELERAGSLDDYVSAFGGIRGREALNKLKELDIDQNHAETYARSVNDSSTCRKVQETMNKGLKWINDGSRAIEIISNLEHELGKVAVYSGAKSVSIMKAPEAVEKARRLHENARTGNSIEIKTGLRDLDNLLGGLFPRELIIVSARTGDGKTALLLTMANNIAIQSKFPKKVGIFSMEMSTEDIVFRLVCQHTGIPINRLRTGRLRDEERDAYEDSMKAISNSPMLIDDTPSLSIPQLRTKIRKMNEDGGVDVVFVDQLNLLSANLPYAKEFEKINWLSYRLKEISGEFEIPVVIAHQMNRGIESSKDQRDPQLSDLEQAGEKATDKVITIRHKKDRGIIISSDLYVLKHRNGSTGVASIKFVTSKVKFENIPTGEFAPAWATEIGNV